MRAQSNYEEEVQKIGSKLKAALKSLEPTDGSIKELNKTWSDARIEVARIIDLLNDDRSFLGALENGEISVEELSEQDVSIDSVFAQHREMLQENIDKLIAALPVAEQMKVASSLTKAQALHNDVLDDSMDRIRSMIIRPTK